MNGHGQFRQYALDPKIERENQIAAHKVKATWLTDEFLAIYVDEFNERARQKHGERIAARAEANGS